MKNRIKTATLASFMLVSAFGYSQSQTDSLGLPGDNLDLNAVLSIFKQSSSVEDFEKRLNSADPKINNLDLNNDQKVDYLRVVDYGKDNFHSLVIQDPVSKSESQDVAVIEVQKNGDNTAHIQIVGDESLYGKNYIIEPTDGQPQAQSSTNNNSSGYNDDVYNTADDNAPSAAQTANSQIMVNVWGWPSVSYLYSPGYSYWSSPWSWGYYPGWYSPWSPYGGYYAYHRGFYGWNYGFYGYRTSVYAFPRAHHYYYGHRASSGYVSKTNGYGGYRSGYRNNRTGGARAINGGGSPRNNMGNGGGRMQNGGQGGRQGNGGQGGGRVQNGGQSSGGGGRIQNQGNPGRSQNMGSSQHVGATEGGVRSNNSGGGSVRQGNSGGGRTGGGGSGFGGGGGMRGGPAGSGGGGGRMSGGSGGGGGRMSGGGGGGGGGHMGGGGGRR